MAEREPCRHDARGRGAPGRARHVHVHASRARRRGNVPPAAASGPRRRPAPRGRRRLRRRRERSRLPQRVGEPVAIPDAAAWADEHAAERRLPQHRLPDLDEGRRQPGGAARHQRRRRAVGVARRELAIPDARRRAGGGDGRAGRERDVHLPGARAAVTGELLAPPASGRGRPVVDGGPGGLPYDHGTGRSGRIGDRSEPHDDRGPVGAQLPLGHRLRARRPDVRHRARRQHPGLRERRSGCGAAREQPSREHPRRGRGRRDGHRPRPVLRHQPLRLRLCVAG